MEETLLKSFRKMFRATLALSEGPERDNWKPNIVTHIVLFHVSSLSICVFYQGNNISEFVQGTGLLKMIVKSHFKMTIHQKVAYNDMRKTGFLLHS